MSYTEWKDKTAEFKKIENTNAVWQALQAAAGVKNRRPTLPQQKYLTVWTQEWHFSVEMIALAFEEMSKHTDAVSFPYVNKILIASYEISKFVSGMNYAKNSFSVTV